MKLNRKALDWLINSGQSVEMLKGYGFLGDDGLLNDAAAKWLVEGGWTPEKLIANDFVDTIPVKSPVVGDGTTLPVRKPEELVNRYFELKDLDDAESKLFKEAHKERAAKMDVCLDDARRWLGEMKVNSLPTAKGVAFFKKKEYVSLDDQDALHKWYCETLCDSLEAVGILFKDDRENAIKAMLGAKMFGFLQKNIMKATVLAELKDTKQLPPGVAYTEEQAVFINRSK
jgi:hypothetical protein